MGSEQKFMIASAVYTLYPIIILYIGSTYPVEGKSHSDIVPLKQDGISVRLLYISFIKFT